MGYYIHSVSADQKNAQSLVNMLLSICGTIGYHSNNVLQHAKV